jgi:hypothetical protein
MPLAKDLSRQQLPDLWRQLQRDLLPQRFRDSSRQPEQGSTLPECLRPVPQAVRQEHL